jgi:hypothetical protein
MQDIKHSTVALKTIQKDGKIDAVVLRIESTGSSEDVEKDRYRHVINHTLDRVPIGCQIIMKSDFCDMKVVDKDTNKIIIVFNTELIDVNIRIW